MKTEILMWAIVHKSSINHLDRTGRCTLLDVRSEARVLKHESETVKRVKVVITDA